MRKRFLFALAVGVMGPPASAARPTPTPSSLHVSVDPRVELFSIVYRLAGSLGGGASHYGREVESHFGQHRKHPAVGVPLAPWPETLHERWTPARSSLTARTTRRDRRERSPG